MGNKIAVIMPFKNSVKWIEKSVESVISQKKLDGCSVHLIMVDDGSDDGSREIAHNYARSISYHYQSKNIEIFITKVFCLLGYNRGPASARNRALRFINEQTYYTHVAFCDSDDVWCPEHLSRSLQEMEESGADMTYANPRVVNETGGELMVYGVPNPEKFDGSLLKSGNYIYISSVLMKAKCVEVGEFDEQAVPMEDWEYWLRISERYKIHHIASHHIDYLWKSEGKSYYTAEQSVAARNRILAANKRKTVVVVPWSAKLPSGRENPKNYPFWVDVVSKLRSEGVHTVQIGGYGERLVGCDEAKFGLSMLELKALLDEAVTFVSVDSFFHHFAAFYGKKGVAIFGKSDPEIFGHHMHTNLLKSREYLRKEQFKWWFEEPYSKDVFIDDNQVVKAIMELVEGKTIYNEPQ